MGCSKIQYMLLTGRLYCLLKLPSFLKKTFIPRCVQWFHVVCFQATYYGDWILIRAAAEWHAILWDLVPYIFSGVSFGVQWRKVRSCSDNRVTEDIYCWCGSTLWYSVVYDGTHAESIHQALTERTYKWIELQEKQSIMNYWYAYGASDQTWLKAPHLWQMYI